MSPAPSPSGFFLAGISGDFSLGRSWSCQAPAHRSSRIFPSVSLPPPLFTLLSSGYFPPVFKAQGLGPASI